MEKIPNALPISSIQDIKNYSIVWFGHQNIAIGDVFLVDKINQKIWLYTMKHPAQNVTLRIMKRYQTDKDKPLLQQRIIIELYRLMANQDIPLHWLKVIGHSDSAKEITNMLYEVRVLQAEAWVRMCKNPVVWQTDEEASKHFDSI